jgi:hypothetical protein
MGKEQREKKKKESRLRNRIKIIEVLRNKRVQLIRSILSHLLSIRCLLLAVDNNIAHIFHLV